jgi:lipoprotein-anchoring transpeptidase ErfK/SrfK
MKLHPFFFIVAIACFSLQALVAEPEPSATGTQAAVAMPTPMPVATPLPMTPQELALVTTHAPLAKAMVPSSPTPLASAKMDAKGKETAKKTAKPTPKSTPKQEKGKIDAEVLKQSATQPLSIMISLSKQRVYLMVGDKVAVDSPISSGKKGHETPKGEYMILEKDPNHQSNLYGDFVNEKGVVVKKGISAKTDTPPAGAHYCGASMKFFMRLSPEGMGMHAGILPGYPASHGCIRLPLEMAKTIYSAVTVKVPVSVTD